jgi:hypothetical protein
MIFGSPVNAMGNFEFDVMLSCRSSNGRGVSGTKSDLPRQLKPGAEGPVRLLPSGSPSAVFGDLSYYPWLRWADGCVATPPIRMEGPPPPLLR